MKNKTFIKATRTQARDVIAMVANVPQSKLARQLGVSQTAVSRWLRNPDTMPGYVVPAVRGLYANKQPDDLFSEPKTKSVVFTGGAEHIGVLEIIANGFDDVDALVLNSNGKDSS